MEHKCKVKMGILMLILFVVFLLKDLGVWGLAGIEAGTIFLLLIGMIMIKMGCCAKNDGCCGSSCEPKTETAKAKKTTKKKK